MDPDEARQRQATHEHAAYVLERAKAAAKAAADKLKVAQADVTAAERAQKDADRAVKDARKDADRAATAFGEVPEELRATPGPRGNVDNGNVTAVQAEVAQGSGGAHEEA